jgi:hypothetical protein
MILRPEHGNANAQGYVYEHVLIASHVLGRPLPPGVEVHHVNEIGDDNANRNLVICESHAYHYLLHARMRAYRATGNVHKRKCAICKLWTGEIVLAGTTNRHRACHTKLQKERQYRKKQLAKATK